MAAAPARAAHRRVSPNRAAWCSRTCLLQQPALCARRAPCFLTGRLSSATGAYDNAADFSVQTPTFAHYLRLAGYRTILAGKMHLCGADQLHGFEERLTTDIYPADLGWTPDWTRLRGAAGLVS